MRGCEWYESLYDQTQLAIIITERNSQLYDSDRTFSTLDSDANPELRRKEAVVVNRYPRRNSSFDPANSDTQSEGHVNRRLTAEHRPTQPVLPDRRGYRCSDGWMKIKTFTVYSLRLGPIVHVSIAGSFAEIP
ncbi:hypothetical protein K0M31_013020 [Melipona bicolor]|uniref:Uncharacterized protein n=1 Tax=Melipona bicolor TaxID=60889 RepID=A0AA40FIF0_9HYME|nr:hypothetical protein K0M31_013020 [Melipona bicolor]